MLKKLLIIIAFALVLATSVFAANSVSILPTYPSDNDNLVCYVNGLVCDSNIGCNAHWYVNNVQTLVYPILPAAYSNVNDVVRCDAWVFGILAGSANVAIWGSPPPGTGTNHPPILNDISNVVMDEDTVRNINLYASDPDGDILTWYVSGNTNIGIVINNGVATLTPIANWNGQETLTFTVSDGRGGIVSDNVIVTVTPVNDPIILNDIPNIEMDENSVYTLDLTPYIIDVDGDLRDIVITGTWNTDISIDLPTRTVTITPHSHWFGTELLTVVVMDDYTNDVDQFLVTVNQVNHLPVIDDFTPNQTNIDMYEGNNLLFSVIASDPEGQPLTYRWVINGNNIATGTSYSYHALDGPSTNTLSVVVSDGVNNVINTWTIHEINVAPIANAHGEYFCEVGHSIFLGGSATDPGILDTFTYEWDLDNNGLYDSNDTDPTLQITCNNLSDFPLRLRVTDKDGGVDVDSTWLHVVNSPQNNQPYFNPHLTNQNAIVNQVFNYDINAYDADVGDVLTYSDNSNLFNIDPVTGLISFIPSVSGVIPVTITVCDNKAMPNSCASESFNIFVSLTGSNSPNVQILNPSDGMIFALGHTITFNGIGNDIEDGVLTGSSLVWTSSIDGFIGNGESFSINSLSAGTHVITLTGTDSDGAVGTDSISIIVSSASSLNPVAIAGNDVNTTRNVWITFNGSSSYDPDGTIVSYSWNFGDGTSGTGAVVQHRYTSAGNYNVTLTVTDNDGLTDSDNLIVRVGSSGGNGGSNINVGYVTSQMDRHLFRINSFKLMSDVNAGEDVKLAVELENLGSYDENINLRLKSSKLLLVRDFGKYEVKEGKTKLIILLFVLPKDASGKYSLNLEAYTDDYTTNKDLEINTNTKEGSVNLLTGNVAGYNIEIEKGISVWIWLILVLILLVLIIMGIWKILK